MKGKNIVFAHFKGGTGKTTSCLNIAGYLHQDEKKVLVVDFDPQGNATSGLGIDKNTLDCSMYDVIFPNNNCNYRYYITNYRIFRFRKAQGIRIWGRPILWRTKLCWGTKLSNSTISNSAAK